MEANLYDLVQFVPEHKWGGCYGFINEKKVYDTDTKYMIGVPVPQQGTAYIYSIQWNPQKSLKSAAKRSSFLLIRTNNPKAFVNIFSVLFNSLRKK